ncbi:hypothetical protein A3E39_00025 [Candidatus Uhrbacteria bacterium RIFCSPHIGHO2_12_FULL_60_25]|uniref:Uncharacterized protein n=1 Tax=Candidatus Uhrbacteria bacterium RIFCSPHIGHO2_12_FULL_60_25 TaxID=1802399 RepID=A0A1F7UP63_9BACT|nr:MAG: hypothetical protein A3D73_02760 [Candidatus Uhrbacteria bacterium RIFCSPHIGHO2_02_FULL_60_44]OGL79498.1 MAG: hypothetical protein A3E39_00025 [Candidatus Uhrbacteria bacterium RIFCSPHIGHO2_12_FULL_60_25]
MSNWTPRRALLKAPLPDKGTSRLDQKLRFELLEHLTPLLSDGLFVRWGYIQPVEPDDPPIVRLSFSGVRVVITNAWCRYFRAQLHPMQGPAWLARAAYYDPANAEVYLVPRHDAVDIEAAILWGDDGHDNPLVLARIGFNYMSPGRDIQLLSLPILIN